MVDTQKTILMTGGGTLGPVMPLLAVSLHLREQGLDVRFVGTANGPERAVVEAAHFPFSSIPAPRLRRFWTWQQVLLPVELIRSLLAAARLLRQMKPALIVSAGGFVSVPIVWMGWLKHIPCLIHQQDIRPGLANRLMQGCAKKITVAFESSVVDFPANKSAEWIGNPVRDLTPTTHTLKLDPNFPTVLLFGGGTGAQALNDLVSKELCDFANVIHLTGVGKKGPALSHPRYHVFELLQEEMKEALVAADVVVCRAGLGTISELAALHKVVILVPIPNSHQEDNAAWMEEQGAAVVFEQRRLSPDRLVRQVQRLLTDQARRAELAEHIGKVYRPDAAQRLAQIILTTVKN